tara:strand:+ start:143 stop:1066 length:924 start_codon:yes stop_codon:yes gene_type:complete
MRGHDHGESYVLIGDPLSEAGMSVRNIFRTIGFREIEVRHSAKRLCEHLDTTETDLLVSEIDLRDGDTCEIVNSLRHGEVGLDPFVPVLGLTWNATPETVRRVAQCGADGLVAMPALGDRFGAAVAALIKKRKPFVVTTDYVGPDRRGDEEPRPGSQQVPLIPVPNALRRKATGLPDAIPFDKCLTLVREQKAERHAFQIGWLTERIIDHFRGREAAKDIRGHLDKLEQVALDLVQRITDTCYAHQGELCRSLVRVSKDLATATEPGESDLELLSELAKALQLAIHSDDASTIEAARDISKAVDARL